MQTLDHLFASLHADAAADAVPARDADLLFYSPCPVKLAVKERIDAICAETGLTTIIPMGCTSVDPYDPLYRESDPDNLPAMIASIGFGDFFRTGFVERFVDQGLFRAVLPEAVHPLHRDAGTVDPEGRYVVYGVTPYIFLVDTSRVGDLPLPTCWEDLLHPRYKGQINMCGDGDDMADAVLLHFYKQFGMAGVERFAANTFRLMHSSNMAQSGGPGGEGKAGSISIIPYFFAESTKQPAHLRTIWPEDGAAASPLYFLAKAGEHERMAPLIRFFTHGFGEIVSARWFLPLGGPMPESLPEGAKLKWVGWDYIRSVDITAVRDELNTAFRKLVQEPR